MKIDPIIKTKLGFTIHESDKDILKVIREKKTIACKPCWELKYCPYGPLVEDFPLLPPEQGEAITRNEYLKNCLNTKTLGNGSKLDSKRAKMFKEEIKTFDPKEYPLKIHPEIKELGCTVFGHLCPVYFVSESFTETERERRRGRYISFEIKMRVVRRDNYTCQNCSKHLLDNEVEFDHIIPVSRGGSSEEHNIRLTCFDCNREKTNKVKI
jgi:hypothetical protein